MGDRDGDELADTALRVVRYEGLQPLRKGERWGFPSYGTSYPLAAFHLPEQFTLCFEDRDGVEGLHRYYDRELQECATRQMLTTDIYLPPEQYVALFDLNGNGANIRSRFRLNIDGVAALFRLDAIESYDSAKYLARCRFQRLCEEL